LVFRRGGAKHVALGRGGAAAVRASAAARRRALAYGVHAPEVLAAIHLDDHGRFDARRLLAIPEEELLALALERNLHQMRSQYHSLNSPIERNFSRRRRTSFSGL